MNKIHYIVFDPSQGNTSLTLGFATAIDAEQFLASQSGNKDWQAEWKLERVFAYGAFHYRLKIDKYTSLTFAMFQ